MSLIVDIKKHFDSFSLSVNFETEGGITSLLGDSGSGKSLTLKSIAGIVRPDEGRIIFDGRILFDSSRRICLPPEERAIGYMFQSYALFPDMNVKKNLLCGLKRVRGREEKERRIKEISEMLHIAHLLTQRVTDLSGGEAQRVAMGRMLLSSPSLLLFDEPFSALDQRLKDDLEPEFLDTIRRSGKESIIVTHSHSEAMHLSEHTMIMHKGHVLRSGDTIEVFKNPRVREVASLFGIRNILEAERADQASIYIKELNYTYTLKEGSVIDGLRAVGIRGFKESSEGLEATVIEILQEMDDQICIVRFGLSDKHYVTRLRKGISVGDRVLLAPAELVQLIN